MNLARFDGSVCSLVPVGRGFDSGVRVACPDAASASIFVEDDLKRGEIRELIDGKRTAVFHYDMDNGVLLQPPDSPGPGISAAITHAAGDNYKYPPLPKENRTGQ